MKTLLLKYAVAVAALLAAASLIGCSTMERVQHLDYQPHSGTWMTNAPLPSQAEQVLAGVMAANTATAPLNPYSGLVGILGQLAGAFLAGYGGAHARIVRNGPLPIPLGKDSAG